MRISAITTAAAILLANIATPLFADGPFATPSDPHVIEPAPDWSGLQIGAGLSIGKDKSIQSPDSCGSSKSTVTIHCGQFTEISWDEDVEELYFARLLSDRGSIVLGGEIGYFNDEAYGEAQVGLDMGRMLPYASYGTMGAAVGVDFKLSERFVLGAKATHLDAQPQPQVRIGIRF